MITIEKTYRIVDGREIEESCLCEFNSYGGELIEILTPELARNLIVMLSDWLRLEALGEDPCCQPFQKVLDECECPRAEQIPLFP